MEGSRDLQPANPRRLVGAQFAQEAEAMTACEHCWQMAKLLGIEYRQQIERAEREHYPCTQDTIDGRKLRAGQFWDSEKNCDSREAHT